MSSLNKITLIGRTGKTPKLIPAGSSSEFSIVSLATNEYWTDDQGNKKSHTDWHTLRFYGKLSILVQQHLKKNALVYIEGKHKPFSYKDKDGQSHHSSYISVSEVKFLENKEKQTTESAGLKDTSSIGKQAIHHMRESLAS